MNSLQRASGLILLCSALAASAQVATQQPVTADSTWQALLSFTSQSSTGGQPQTLSQEITQLQQEAQQAKTFYTTFAADPRADTAKKLEALSNIQAVQLGASGSVQTTALAVAAAFINDTTQAIQDRFDVGLAVALISGQASLKGMGPADNGPAYEAIADSLHTEFGDVAPVYSYYLSLTISADNATAANIASKIQTMNAPSWAKAQAQVVLSRAALVGTTVPLVLTSTSNQSIDLSQASGQVTVVYLWGGSASMNDLAVLNPLKGSMPSGARWIYVALNSPSPSLSTVQAQAPFSGTQCFDPVNLAGFVPQTLFTQVTPYAYVFDATGKLIGYGPPILIPSLLTAAGL